MEQLFSSCTMLAGGKSTRMGRDKELISQNTTQILSLLQQLFTQVIVITNNPTLYDEAHLTLAADIIPDCGPLGGIFSALCLSQSEYLFVVACDMPHIDAAFIKLLQGKALHGKKQAVLFASARGLEPLAALYSRSLLNEMRDFLLAGGRKIQDFLEGKDCLILEKEELFVSDNTFTNHNFPQMAQADISSLATIVPARRCTLSSTRELQETVVRESCLEIYYNGIWRDKLICSPENLRELCIGRLFSLGLISNAEQIKQIDFENGKCFAEGDISLASALPKLPAAYFKIENIITLSSQFLTRSVVFDKTGGVHSGAVSDGTQLLCFFEDIGRYNVADKCIAYCLLNNLDMRDKVIFTSGRVASELIDKITAAGFPLLVSRAAPTDKAIKTAKQNNLSLVAFARNGRFNIYSDFERVLKNEN